MSTEPSPNGHNGRHRNGQFVKGNAGGPGNPHGRRVATLRAMLLAEVGDEDFKAVARRLVELAKEGDLPAVRELFDRMLGKPKGSAELLEEEITTAELDEAIEHQLQLLATKRQAPPP